MKKLLLFLIFSIISSVFGVAKNVYYVSTTGDDNNSGLSESQAWRTITFAASSTSPVSPGDIVYIKAGNYENENVVFEIDGTKGNPITFEGYQTVPGDNPDPGWKYGDSLDASEMPLLDGDDRSARIGIKAHSRKYIIIKNIQIRNYRFGLYAWNAHNIKISNIIAMNFGDINADYDGYGIFFGSLTSNNTIENCSVLNSAAEGISIYGDNNYLKNCRVYGDDNSTGDKSSTDYYIHIGGNNNIVESCHVERIGNLEHGGHGIDIKGNCENNLILNCVSKGMREEGFELRHRGVRYNTLENCITINGGYAIRDGASYNTIKNCKSINASYAAVLFYDTDEDGGAHYCGRYNVFENCIFQDTKGYEISFVEYNLASIADSNTFVNCVFDGGEYLFNCDRENKNNKMVNCIVTNVKNYYTTANNQPIEYPLNFDFEYTVFWNNGFDSPSGVNVMTIDPEFVDISNNDYHLRPTSPCIDAGTSDGAPLTDFDGNPRLPANRSSLKNIRPLKDFEGNTSPTVNRVDIGAYEYLRNPVVDLSHGRSSSNTNFIHTGSTSDKIIINAVKSDLNNIKICDMFGHDVTELIRKTILNERLALLDLTKLKQ